MRILRDICRWHVEEFAYLVAKLKSMPEGDGTLLDNTCLLFAHEHAEANAHKNNNLAVIVAGHAGGIKTGLHTRTTGTLGDLYVTIADEAIKAGIRQFPTAEKKLSEIV
jgi:4-hydroxy-3-methylbut-2-enyl diphosphate reductase IspH